MDKTILFNNFIDNVICVCYSSHKRKFVEKRNMKKQKTEDFIANMTLEEKISQLTLLNVKHITQTAAEDTGNIKGLKIPKRQTEMVGSVLNFLTANEVRKTAVICVNASRHKLPKFLAIIGNNLFIFMDTNFAFLIVI